MCRGCCLLIRMAMTLVMLMLLQIVRKCQLFSATSKALGRGVEGEGRKRRRRLQLSVALEKERKRRSEGVCPC